MRTFTEIFSYKAKQANFRQIFLVGRGHIYIFFLHFIHETLKTADIQGQGVNLGKKYNFILAK